MAEKLFDDKTGFGVTLGSVPEYRNFAGAGVTMMREPVQHLASLYLFFKESCHWKRGVMQA
eukprot:2590868-Amphidinium_carterae.1